MLAELQSDTNQALEDLRDLARIYPPLLADKDSRRRREPGPEVRRARSRSFDG